MEREKTKKTDKKKKKDYIFRGDYSLKKIENPVK